MARRFLVVMTSALIGIALLVPHAPALADEPATASDLSATGSGFAKFLNPSGLTDAESASSWSSYLPLLNALPRETIESYVKQYLATHSQEDIQKFAEEYQATIGDIDKLTLDQATAIEIARIMYDQLSDDQKAQLGETWEQTLTAAEAKIAELRTASGEDQTQPTSSEASTAPANAATDKTGESVSLAPNPLKVHVTNKTVKLKKSKKARTVRPVTVSGNAGAVTFTNVSKATKAKKFKVAAKTGKVTVTANAKKNTTYKLKIRVSAVGDASHLPATKTVTCKIKVR